MVSSQLKKTIQIADQSEIQMFTVFGCLVFGCSLYVHVQSCQLLMPLTPSLFFLIKLSSKELSCIQGAEIQRAPLSQFSLKMPSCRLNFRRTTKLGNTVDVNHPTMHGQTWNITQGHRLVNMLKNGRLECCLSLTPDQVFDNFGAQRRWRWERPAQMSTNRQTFRRGCDNSKYSNINV